MKEHLIALLRGPLDGTATAAVFSSLMENSANPASDAQVGAYLYATAQRLPTAEELAAAAGTLREHMVAVELGSTAILDTAGTGGSGLSTFNTSTIAGFICAAFGQGVAKHGNRAATSACGSADLIEALGMPLDLNPETIRQCFQATNFCFLFAPAHHPATRRVVRIRRELGFRTIFNFLGPLCNPAGARFQVVGVSDRNMVRVMADALLRLGTERALVVRGEDGLDELSICAPTYVCEVSAAGVKEYTVTPEDVGLARRTFAEIEGRGPGESALLTRALLSGKAEAFADFVCLNAGAGLYVSGHAVSIEEGVRMAKACLQSGAPTALLERCIALTTTANS